MTRGSTGEFVLGHHHLFDSPNGIAETLYAFDRGDAKGVGVSDLYIPKIIQKRLDGISGSLGIER